MATRGRLKVLLADDEAEVREMMAEYLTGRGCEVLQAANGLEALLQVKRERPKAVVLDIQMPRLRGVDAIRHIRAFDPSIVVVVVTGDTDARLHTQARERGASTVLVKPVELQQLAAAVLPSSGIAPVPALVSAPAPSVNGASRQILIVDDDQALSDVTRDLFRTKGYRARAVGDAASALRDIGANPPDVILLDINMPGLSGVDALPAIRALAPHAAVIMVSGTTQAEDGKRALSYGAFDYVTKPIDLGYLVQAIETALEVCLLNS